MIIATWLHEADENSSTFMPNVSGLSSGSGVSAIYWKCVACFFYSARVCNPAAKLLLFTNAGTLPRIEGMDISAFLKTLEVDIVVLPLSYLPPEGYSRAWRTQFYILDIILWSTKSLAARDVLTVLDSDCIFYKNVDGMEGDVLAHSAITLDLHYGETDNINGLSRKGIMQIMTEDKLACNRVPEYCGGEIFSATGDYIRKIGAEMHDIWERQLYRNEKGLLKLTEEAHFLSLLYHKHGVQMGTANPYIRRIWTAIKYNTAQVSDRNIPIWHLPSEKRTGFARMYTDLAAQKLSQISKSEVAWREYLEHRFGVPRKSAGKWLMDVAAKLREISK